MPETSLWQHILAFVRENEFLVELLVFALGFAESVALMSFLVPASVLFLAVAALQSAGNGPFLPILFAGALGCLAGDMVSYMIGWRVRHRIGGLWPFRSRPDLLARTRWMIRRHGIYAIVVSKFVGPLRPLTPLFAGVTTMPWVKFASASAVSSLLWALAFLAPAYYGVQLLVPA